MADFAAYVEADALYRDQRTRRDILNTAARCVVYVQSDRSIRDIRPVSGRQTLWERDGK